MFESLKTMYQRLSAFYDGRTPALRRWLVATSTTLLVGPIAYFAYLRLSGTDTPRPASGAIAPVQIPNPAPDDTQQFKNDPGDDAFPEVSFNRLGSSGQTSRIPAGPYQPTEAERRETQESQRKVEIAIARSKVLEVKAAADETERAVEQLRIQRQRWHEQYETLWKDERGKRIAVSESLATDAIAVLNEKLPTQSDLESQQSSLSLLATPIQEASDSTSPNAEAIESLRPRLVEIDTEVKKMQKTLETSMASLDRIIARTAKTPLGELTLAEVQTVREIAQANDARIEDEANQSKTDKANRDAEEKRKEKMRLEEIARLKLEQDFELDYPPIKARLVAFTSDGMHLRGNDPGPGPVSFSLMQGKGALERTETGRQQIAIVVGESRRESGGLMRFQGGQSDQQARDFDEVQQFLSKYGLLMVDKKLLAP